MNQAVQPFWLSLHRDVSQQLLRSVWARNKWGRDACTLLSLTGCPSPGHRDCAHFLCSIAMPKARITNTRDSQQRDRRVLQCSYRPSTRFVHDTSALRSCSREAVQGNASSHFVRSHVPFAGGANFCCVKLWAQHCMPLVLCGVCRV